MAAPGGGELRVRLLFDYPPPALPQSRQLWFMLDTDLCRAVTDVSAIIRERFFYSRRGALSLYLDGCLLPPGESVRVIRDNEAIRVKWDETCGHGDPQQTCRKRRRSEDESDDHRGASKKSKETPEEEISERRRKKKNKGVVTLEEDCERPKKKKATVALEEDGERPKKNKATVALEEDSERPKKNKATVALEEDGELPKKNRRAVTPTEASERPKKNKTMLILEEDCHRPKKYNSGAVTQTEVSERAKKNKQGVTLEIVSEPSKKKKGAVIPTEDSEWPSEKTMSPQQDSEPAAEASKKKPKRFDVSKKPPHVALGPGEPCSAVQKEVQSPGSATTRMETSSSSSSDQEDTAKPGPSLKMPDDSSSLDGFIIKKPLTSGLAIPSPVYNGHVARGGARPRPPLKTAAYGVGRGRDIENLPWRGRGYRGRGKAQLQNHFFYNYSPETIKQQHLNEDVSNVSVLIENPPEVPKKDYSSLPLLAAPPQPGNIIAFKLLELTENYTPEVSDYKEGRILGYDPLSQQLEVEVLSQQKKKEPGKFDLVYEGEDGMNIVEYAVPQECKITQTWSSLIEPRLVTEHGPQQQLAAVPQGD